MTDSSQPDLTGLLREILQQQTAMLQVQAESVRLQRALVERLLGDAADYPSRTPAASTPPPRRDPALAPPPPPPPPPPAPTGPAPEVPVTSAPREPPPEPPAPAPPASLACAPPPVDQGSARGARYYQPRHAAAATTIAPDELELLRRLQEMRDASDLILQFGPHRGATLAQVAISNPEYIRELMRGARRPEVRAAAGRLVQALDAAAEHKPKARTSARRGHPGHA